VEFRLLGALEVVDGGRRVALGGARQRALLTLLLLHRNEVLTPDRIVDDLWHGDPPRTAQHIVRVYVSQLRKALEPERGDAEQHVLLTRGSGYLLQAAPQDVDLDCFVAALAEGRRLRREGSAADAAAAFREALALWRGPPLQDVAYESFAQGEIARLEELRLATLEERFEAELAAGDDAALVADLERLVAESPLRERLRAQLMLALYRSGRQADALAVYAEGRRALVDELGLEPASDLRELQARILRHDPGLDRPAAGVQTPSGRRPRRRRNGAALAAISLAAIVAVAVHFATSGGPAVNRLTTVVMAGPQRLSPAPVDAATLAGVRAARRDLRADIRVTYAGSSRRNDLERALVRAAGPSGLVIVSPTPYADIVAGVARRFPHTRFLFGEYPVDEPPFNGLANVTGLEYDNREIGFLAGYLAAAMTPGGAVSVVGGVDVPPVEQLTAGFTAGARAARPGIRVLAGDTGSFADQSRCERLANAQIDAGSRVIFDAAGDCGFGALQAAGIRGVWGIGVDSDLSYLGPHILASAVKRLDLGPELAVKLFLDDALPAGRDLRLDLSSDSVGLVGISDRVPAAVRSRLERVAADLRRRDGRRPRRRSG
jgi:DNA-binding SARP family transcriptional activator/basic membrane lipoprotein Med (substrate-binding protein (PBP1-ABC) superfamily)